MTRYTVRTFFSKLSHFCDKKRWFEFPCWLFAKMVRTVFKLTVNDNNWDQKRSILRFEASFGSRSSFRSIFKHIRNCWKAISLNFAGPFRYDNINFFKLLLWIRVRFLENAGNALEIQSRIFNLQSLLQARFVIQLFQLLLWMPFWTILENAGNVLQIKSRIFNLLNLLQDRFVIWISPNFCFGIE